MCLLIPGVLVSNTRLIYWFTGCLDVLNWFTAWPLGGCSLQFQVLFPCSCDSVPSSSHMNVAVAIILTSDYINFCKHTPECFENLCLLQLALCHVLNLHQLPLKSIARMCMRILQGNGSSTSSAV